MDYSEEGMRNLMSGQYDPLYATLPRRVLLGQLRDIHAIVAHPSPRLRSFGLVAALDVAQREIWIAPDISDKELKLVFADAIVGCVLFKAGVCAEFTHGASQEVQKFTSANARVMVSADSLVPA